MRHVLSTALIAIAMLPSLDKPGQAAEAATGVYLLGSRAGWAGITPPPGVYFQDDTYFYSGKIGGSIGYAFEVDKLPVSTRIKVYRAFDVQNRMEGTAGFFHRGDCDQHRQPLRFREACQS